MAAQGEGAVRRQIVILLVTALAVDAARGATVRSSARLQRCAQHCGQAFRRSGPTSGPVDLVDGWALFRLEPAVLGGSLSSDYGGGPAVAVQLQRYGSASRRLHKNVDARKH